MCSEITTDNELSEKGFTDYGNHVVCLIDVLGQKDKLKEWDMLDNGDPSQKGLKTIGQTAVTVRKLERLFVEHFKTLAGPIKQNEAAHLPDEYLAKLNSYWDCLVEVERFSDTFVFHSPVSNSSGDNSVAPLYKIISASCHAMILSLASQTPIRGAISIGLGAVLDDKSFYGPALADAHHLESKVAGHPRIIVSDKVVKFIKQSEPYSQDAFVDNGMKLLANMSESLFLQDVDGYWTVDFLGQTVWDVLNQEELYVLAVAEGYNFVRSEAKRFRDSKNAKLAVRYYLLQQYFESRLKIWGIEPEEVTS